MVHQEEPTFRVEGDPVGAQRLRFGGWPAVPLEAGTEAAGAAADDDRDPVRPDAIHAGGCAVGGIQRPIGSDGELRRVEVGWVAGRGGLVLRKDWG